MPATNELTIDKVNSWNANQLLEWIQQNLTSPLDKEDKRLFLKAKINGEVFLSHAGDIDWFENKCKMPVGTSESLANLAGKITGRKGKHCRLHHTLHATAN
jgi:hypothetical protein